ncbi:MAG: hypothetical protein R2828_10970 [Saprospiraceae bacterium]
MNTPIVNTTFRFVRRMFRQHLPEGFDRFQLDQAVILKNSWVSKGLKRGLEDEALEILALTALLCHVGIIEQLNEHTASSQFIAKCFLEEEGYGKHQIQLLLHALAVANQDCPPISVLEEIINQDKRVEIGDVWP